MISLPIDPYLEEIVQTFQDHSNLVLTASPGSGKTTRVPATLKRLFTETEKKIIVLVPKRIAAIGAASRIAEENNWQLGEQVGYQVRFEQKFSVRTALIFMTTGVFMKKVNDEIFWNEIGMIIFDEFHERSSLIDLALGLSLERQILGQDLKLVVMSATLNVEKLQDFLPEPAHIDVANKVFDLQIVKSKKQQRLNCDAVFMDQLAEALKQGLALAKRDALVFLPGLSEMRFAERVLAPQFRSFDFDLMHGSMKLDEQKRVLAGSNRRRIILSTNIAESSVTIPGVDLVVDSGLEKKPVLENKIGFSRLELSRISLFSAHQRAGRAARTSNGYCFEMWHEADERSMPEQIEPEVLSSPMLEETLTLISAGVSNPAQFSWLDTPLVQFSEVLKKLKTLNLINDQHQLTDFGAQVRACPLDLERAVLFTALALAGHQKQASRLLAFIETYNSDHVQSPIDLNDLRLNDLGKRIEQQLTQMHFKNAAAGSGDFKDELIRVFFSRMPHKVAKKKEGVTAISSLGRGLEMNPALVQKGSDFYLLLNGRELNSSTTLCDLAIGFSQTEFDRLSRGEVQVIADEAFDFEKRRLYRTEKKTVGHFVVSESPRSYLNENQHKDLFKRLFKESWKTLLEMHDSYAFYDKKYHFLKRKASLLGLKQEDFISVTELQTAVLDSVLDVVGSLEEFFNMKMDEILIFHTPDHLQTLMRQLPHHYQLPNGKAVPVDYESEQAPKISARIQELFSLKSNPTVLDGKIRMTLELLAPNYRPTQITSQLENFWTTSYFEIRKELKARYPKHPWPDDPANTVPLPPKPPRKF
jgi:ATP-dependent helicase HrpB